MPREPEMIAIREHVADPLDYCQYETPMSYCRQCGTWLHCKRDGIDLDYRRRIDEKL
jgi:hypothetical protein